VKLARDLTCAELVELVTEYLEGGLTAADRERFEEHLVFCGACATYLDQMRATLAVLGRLEEDDLAPDARQALLVAFRDWQAG
jgi:hypothetical protein